MKVAWVVRPAAGGILQHLSHLLKGLGNEYKIIVCGPQMLAKWVKNCPFYPLELNDGIDPLKDLQGILQLSRILKAEKPNLIHAHGLKSVMITVPSARILGMRNILFTAHNCLPRPGTRWHKVTQGLIHRMLMRSLNRVITVSNAVRQDMISYIPPYKLVTIYNGVDYRCFSGYSRQEARKCFNFHSHNFVVGIVSRLIMDKGIATLLQAASLLKHIQPNIKFVIVGEGPLQRYFENYSRALDLSNTVTFTGYRKDVGFLMAGWDLYALPSLSEGFSVSVLEAMAACLPVVVSDLPSMHEMVINNKGGYFVKPGDAPSLAAAILNILKDPDKARAMGEYNHKRIITHFGVERMVQRTAMQYYQLTREEEK